MISEPLHAYYTLIGGIRIFIALQLLLACGAGYSVYRALIYKDDSSQNETDEV